MILLAEETGFGPLIWTFVNSPVGVSLIGGVLLFLLQHLWKAKPGWEQLYDQYKGLFFDAVRAAEKAIPDDVESTSGKKADAALQLLLKLEPALSNKPPKDLKLALEKAHSELEKKQKKGAAL